MHRKVPHANDMVPLSVIIAFTIGQEAGLLHTPLGSAQGEAYGLAVPHTILFLISICIKWQVGTTNTHSTSPASGWFL